MPIQARPERALMEQRLKEGIKSFEEIAEETGYTLQHVRKVARRLKVNSAPPPPKKIFVSDMLTPHKTETTATTTPRLIEVQEQAERTPQPTAQTGLITPDQIASLFKSANSMLPVKYRRDDESLNLLGNVWNAPLNRVVGQYADENVDIYLAVVTTIIVFAPVPVMYVKDRREAMKKKQNAEREDET